MLREAPEDGVALREGFAEKDLPWLIGIVKSLEKDGLVRVSPAKDRPQALAEERAPYGADRPESSPDASTRVSLP